jgi:hypothetical protein
VKGVSEKFRCIGNWYNIRTIFKTKHTLSSSLMKTRPERDPRHTPQCIYSTPCECGRRYIGEIGRPLAVRLREYRQNLKKGLLQKSKLAQHASKVDWDEARILEIESNTKYRKYKELAHMACLINPISQPSLDISPIWIPVISDEVTNSQKRSICVFSRVPPWFLSFQFRVFSFYSLDGVSGKHSVGFTISLFYPMLWQVQGLRCQLGSLQISLLFSTSVS